jgi:hypothetical protein
LNPEYPRNGPGKAVPGSQNGESGALSRRSRVFLHKTARSISEIQPGLDSIPDIVVFLEVLGYKDSTATENGFAGLYDLAAHLYEFSDLYASRAEASVAHEKWLEMPVPGVGRRLLQGIGLSFPWLGALTMLLLFGVSLWLVYGLPASFTTAMIIGVFLGLVVSEGPLQLFQRLVSFYYNQSNLSEMKRAIKRSALFFSLIGLGMVGLVYAVCSAENIPGNLMQLTVLVSASILGIRASYVIIYSLKKFIQLVASYAVALSSIPTVYFLLYNIIPGTLPRYLTALGTALIVLSVVPIYYIYRVFTANSVASLDDLKRHRLNPIVVNASTIPSSFSVQFWEGVPYYLFGTFFFIMLFGDRILSWLYNPVHVANGILLPLVFNPAYHLGADLALLVVLPASVIQYTLLTNASEMLSNLSLRTSISKYGQADDFLRRRYRLMLICTVVSSATVAGILIQFAPQIMGALGGSSVSLRILETAAVANVLLTVFMANSLFLIYLNKVKPVLVVAAVGAGIIGIAGALLGQSGFQYIILAYLLSAASTCAISSIMAAHFLKNPSRLFFSRYA